MEDGRSGSKWGINPDPVRCPKCGELMPAVRKPDGWRQLLWGGWTCPRCNCRMDKWGQPQAELPRARARRPKRDR